MPRHAAPPVSGLVPALVLAVLAVLASVVGAFGPLTGFTGNVPFAVSRGAEDKVAQVVMVAFPLAGVVACLVPRRLAAWLVAGLAVVHAVVVALFLYGAYQGRLCWDGQGPGGRPTGGCETGAPVWGTWWLCVAAVALVAAAVARLLAPEPAPAGRVAGEPVDGQ